MSWIRKANKKKQGGMMRRKTRKFHGLVQNPIVMFIVYVGHFQSAMHRAHKYATVWKGLSQGSKGNGIDKTGVVDALGAQACSVKRTVEDQKHKFRYKGRWIFENANG